MVNLLKTSGRVAGTLFAAALLLSAQERIARPGMVNYTEGQVTLNGQTLGSSQIGKVEVAPGQVLETQDGRAEMLLTPGVFLRLSDHSAVRMVSPSLIDTRVELLRGSAMVEAAQVEKENHLDIIDHGANTVLEKRGIYSFNANQPTVAVFEGKAEVQQDDHTTDVNKGKELALGNPQLKVQKFDAKAAENHDPLYAWSKLRSEYIADANMSLAQTVVVDNPGWWYGTGWYWNPYFASWAFMPGGGYLYDPFGFGFYSPAYWGTYYAPYYYGAGRGYRTFNGRAPVFRAPATSPLGRSFPAVRSFGGGGLRMGGGMRGGHFGGRR